MKYVASFVWFAALTAGLVVPTAVEAAGLKPIAVLSLTAHQDLQGNTAGIGELAKVSDLPTWLSSMLTLFAEGKDVNGLDAARPWGVVLQLGDGLSAYGFVPVNDPEGLRWALGSYIKEMKEVGQGVYHVVGTEPGKELYARLSGDWIYVAATPKDLAYVATNPATLLGGLEKKFDAALRVETRNIPEKEGRAIINLLGEKLGSVIRQHASDQAVNFLGQALFASEQVVMGWKTH